MCVCGFEWSLIRVMPQRSPLTLHWRSDEIATRIKAEEWPVKVSPMLPVCREAPLTNIDSEDEEDLWMKGI